MIDPIPDSATIKASQQHGQQSRRSFLQRSSLVVAGGSSAVFAAPGVRSAHAAGSDVLRIGLIGCGSRGTGAATQALQADPQVKLVAMGDAFEDRLRSSLKTLA